MSGEIPSPSTEVIDIDKEPSPSEFDPSLSEDERRFYLKAYPNIEMVRDRKLHCTTCKMHIGTAPSQEGIIKMHPVLRVTHCSKCHDFYNSGEFSKGEDGSELYCRWCGQGGEVYCCSNCPYVFCKSCIVKNLSRGVVADIEQNENWSCFNCAPKILWPLRAQHWALIKFIEKQKKLIVAKNLPESETKQLMMKDQSTCCRLAKAKCGNMSDSVESIDSLSRRSTSSASPAGQTGKKLQKIVPRSQSPAAKRAKHSNDEVVCTPDLLSMLEPDCQITVSAKQRPSQSPVVSTPKVMSIQNTSNYGGNSPMLSATAKNTPPPLVLRNTSVQMRPITPSSGGRRTVLGPRAPSTSNTSPVYHTINGYRIDLNTAAQQETFRLPNGKLIQVKRQGASNQAVAPHGQPTTPHGQPPSPAQPTQPPHGWQRNVHMQAQHSTRPVQIAPTHPNSTQQYPQITIQQHVPQQHPQMLRYQNTMVGHTTVTAMHNGPPPQIHVINGSGGTQLPHPAGSVTPQPQPPPHAPPISIVRPAMTRLIFPNTPIGQARSQLQDQVFNAMEICQHLTGKVQTLTNSNAYKQARNYLEVKELYIHLSYLLTYAIGRFKGLQDKCLADMRHLGFVNDADSLQNGQLAAGVDYVRYGQLDDVEFFNTGSNSFHHQIYEYRKSLHANLGENGGGESGVGELPLSPLLQLGTCFTVDDDDESKNAHTDMDAPVNAEAESNANGNHETLDQLADAVASKDDVEEEPTATTTGETETETQQSLGKETPSSDNPDPEDATSHSRYEEDSSLYNSCMGADEENAEYEEEDDYDMSRPGGGTGETESHRHSDESHAIDHKLMRLIEQYPSIWCTRHPDYGNYEITRQYWHQIGQHFRPNENIKLRWKNIRKRFVRIEERLRIGKRYNGHYDKAVNFLFNRNLAQRDWLPVDKGGNEHVSAGRLSVDGGKSDQEKRLMTVAESAANSASEAEQEEPPDDRADFHGTTMKPLEISRIDMKIINFVKCNPVLWRRTTDLACYKMDEQTRRSLWTHLWKQLPTLDCDELVDRWAHLYELYKTFRLKHIRNKDALADLEVKYSKYLATLHFLYKIDENDMKRENLMMMDCGYLDELPEQDLKLQQMPDDREFVLAVVSAVYKRPLLWNNKHRHYDDHSKREHKWTEIEEELKDFKRNAKTIKLRWHLARFCYLRLRRERKKYLKEQLPKYCINLPVNELKFLNIR